MADMIAGAHAWLNQQLKANASTNRTYRRGASTCRIAMTDGGPRTPLFSLLGATPGTMDTLQQTPENAVRSFAFDVQDLNFGAGPVTPDTGDEVLETINGAVHVFQVMPPTSGQLAWDWQTEFRGDGARYLVHTQLVGTE
jgi:hypothetical protein